MVAPSYYKQFTCTNKHCTDNCCIGWEIDIDDATLAQYKAITGSFGKQLNKNILAQNGTHFFALKQKGRCAFLNENNLCDIIIQLGENALCQICARHPRHYTWLNSTTEVGIGIACEEAARIIIGATAPFTLTKTNESISPETPDESICEEGLLAVRNTLFALVQDKNFSQAVRQGLMLMLAENAQTALQQNNPEILQTLASQFTQKETLQNGKNALAPYIEKGDIDEPLKQLLLLFLTMDILQEDWKSLLQQTMENLPAVIKALPTTKYTLQTECQNLLWYFLYRYFMQSTFDGDALSKVHLAIVSVILLQVLYTQQVLTNPLLQGQNTFITLAKNFSKEIEYANSNIARIYDASFENDLFMTQTLLSLL